MSYCGVACGQFPFFLRPQSVGRILPGEGPVTGAARQHDPQHFPNVRTGPAPFYTSDPHGYAQQSLQHVLAPAGRQRASVPVLARGGRHPGRGSGLGLAMSYRSGARLGGVVAPREPMTWPGAVRHVRPRSRLQLGRLSSRCYFWLPDVAWKRNSTTSPSRLWAVLTCPLLARRPGPDCPANTYAVRASIRCSVTEPGSSSSSICFTSPDSDR